MLYCYCDQGTFFMSYNLSLTTKTGKIYNTSILKMTIYCGKDIFSHALFNSIRTVMLIFVLQHVQEQNS